MGQEWILHEMGTRRAFAAATWIPLRASTNDEVGRVTEMGYVSDVFACGSAALPPVFEAWRGGGGTAPSQLIRGSLGCTTRSASGLASHTIT